MKWYHYLMCFLGGVFMANCVPHFVEGITGNAFPTPFASPPPPEGLSSAGVNVAWGLSNFVVGYLLLRFGRFDIRGPWPVVVITFVAFAAFSFMLGNVFTAVPR
jgi:MFS family permease